MTQAIYKSKITEIIAYNGILSPQEEMSLVPKHPFLLAFHILPVLWPVMTVHPQLFASLPLKKKTNTSQLQKRESAGASFLYWLDWKSKHFNQNVYLMNEKLQSQV